MNPPTWCMLALSIALLATPVITAQEVSGAYESTEVTIAPKHVFAFPTRSSWNPLEEGIEIMLSEAPPDIEAATASLDPHGHAINQDVLDDTNWICVYIWPDGVVAMNATVSKGMRQVVDNTNMSLSAELKVNTPEEVAGRIFTKEPVEMRDDKSYTVDLSFSTKVIRPPKGIELPAGGGDPGKALLAIPGAARLGDANTLARMLGERYCSVLGEGATNQERMECYLWELPNWLAEPGDPAIKVLGGNQTDDSAVLDVELVHSAGYSMLSLVRMLKTDTGWVFDEQAIAGMME